MAGGQTTAQRPTATKATGDGSTAARAARLTTLPQEHLELVLRQAGHALTINEIRAHCGASVAQVSAALTRLERTRRVRFVSGRWMLTR